jgi:hypothetical protein
MDMRCPGDVLIAVDPPYWFPSRRNFVALGDAGYRRALIVAQTPHTNVRIACPTDLDGYSVRL